jgi:C-terminal processing protease CtpA/Prc
LPDDTNVDKDGIKPDIEVPFDREQYEKNSVDVQKEKAFEEIKKIMQ